MGPPPKVVHYPVMRLSITGLRKLEMLHSQERGSTPVERSVYMQPDGVRASWTTARLRGSWRIRVNEFTWPAAQIQLVHDPACEP
jgi:hypothetical protein